MVSFNIAVDDSSPLISYGPLGAWIDVPSNDSLVQSYTGHSAHTTSVQGATATIAFYGTGITIYGGKRPTYGTYTFSVDGQAITSGSASSSTPTFNQLLGQASGLADTPHSCVLTFTGSNASIDIDWLEFESQIGPPGAILSNTTIDDSDPRIQYSGSDWQTNNVPLFINSTLHFTKVAGASATLSFSGDAVAIYGTVSPDHANIRVNLDGQAKTFGGGAGGVTQSLHARTLLYFANHLSSQQHTLAVIADPEPGTGPFIDVDAFTIYSASGGTTTTTSNPLAAMSQSAEVTPSATQGDNAKVSHVSTSTVVGAAVGGVLGAAIIVISAILVFCLFRRRRRRPQGKQIDVSRPLLTPALPIQRPATEARFDVPFSVSRAPNTVTVSHFRNASQQPLVPVRPNPDLAGRPTRPLRSSFHWLGE